MTNIAPELLQQIQDIFNKKYEKATLLGGPISNTLKKLENGTATFTDADMYATKVGTMYSEAMREVLVLENMPNETFYYNIAKQTIEPSLQEAYGLISNVALSIQDDINHTIGVNLKAAVPEFDKESANVICNNAAKAKTQEELDAALTEPVETHCKRVVDSTQRKNAELHNKAGLKVRVSREYDGVGLHRKTKYAKKCSWCEERCKTNMPYDKALAIGMFQRHDGCGCLIKYTSEKGKTTYSNGKNSGWSEESPETKEKRINKINDIENNNKVQNQEKIKNAQNIKTLEEQKEEINNDLRATIVDQHNEYLDKYAQHYAKAQYSDDFIVKENNLSKLKTDDSRKIINTIKELEEEYYSPLESIITMDANEAVRAVGKTYATTTHNYEIGASQIKFNPILVSESGKKKLIELANRGYCVSFSEGQEVQFLTTHEFAHSILNIKQPLPTKSRNFIQADYSSYASARKELNKVYDEYKIAVREAEKEYDLIAKPIENKYINGEILTEAEKKEFVKIKSDLRETIISERSLDDVDEFLAEGFTDYKFHQSNANMYSQKVGEIIDKYFRK